MTTPTLAQFAKALDAVRKKYPDAPGLPFGYSFANEHGETLVTLGRFEPVPITAALALCVVTAMEIGAWWVKQRKIDHHLSLSADTEGEWALFLRDENGPLSSMFKRYSLPSAALAMLVAIGGQ